MRIRIFAISMLGMAGLVVPAHASLTFFNGTLPATSQISSYNALADPLIYQMQGMFTFLSADVSGSPAVYNDPNTGAEFFGFKLSGSNSGAATSLAVSSAALVQATAGQGGIIEVTNLPAETFAFAADITTTTASGGFCIEVNHSSYNTSSNCDDVFAVSSPSNTQFIGVVSTVPITSIWFGPDSPSSVATEVVKFEIGDVPEVSTFALIGSGLIFLGALRRRKKPGAGPSR
jgi:hypothetical protein